MEFSDSVYSLGLIQDITFLTGVDLNKYPVADRTRNINSWSSYVWSIIFEVYGGWIFDDNNVSAVDDLPNSTINVVSGTALYGLPPTAITVRKIEILLSDGSTWKKLNPVSLEQINNEGEFLNTDGTPRFYRLVGDVIKLYPAPNYSGTNYLKVFFDRGMVAFAATDSTATPGFSSPYHRILSIGASLDYVAVNGPERKVKLFETQITNYEKRIKKFYSQRFVDNFPNKIKVDDSVKQYK